MKFLTEELGVAEAQVLKIVIRSPILLSYGIESMRGKASYLKEGLQLDDADVRTGDARVCPGIMGFMRHLPSLPYCIPNVVQHWYICVGLDLQDCFPTAIPLLSTQHHVSRFPV